MSFRCSTAWKCTGAWPTRAAERFRRWCFFLVAAAHGWSCNDAGATAMLQRENLTDVDPLALCNNGSPAMFYMQENISSSEWVVYLAGGGWCYDLESCQGRSMEASSHDSPATAPTRACHAGCPARTIQKSVERLAFLMRTGRLFVLPIWFMCPTAPLMPTWETACSARGNSVVRVWFALCLQSLRADCKGQAG